jgi:hypothetical protein
MPDEVRSGLKRFGGKTGVTHWLQPTRYALAKYEEKRQRIGNGRDDR